MQQLALPLDPDPLLPRIRDILVSALGHQHDAQRHHPNLQFLRAMLSSRTRDQVSQEALLRLLNHLSSLDDLAQMAPERLAELIHDVTYASDKAVYLVEASQVIQAHRGRIDLTFLADWTVDDALSWLQRMRGVGPKVAGSVLNFSQLRMRAFAFDTHVLRVFKRLGFLKPTASFDHAFRTLMRRIPNEWNADDLYELHWLVKMHGQKTCTHRNPACHECRLIGHCPSAARSAIIDASQPPRREALATQSELKRSSVDDGLLGD